MELVGDDARLRIFDTGHGGADTGRLEVSATANADDFVEDGASVHGGNGRRHVSRPKTISG